MRNSVHGVRGKLQGLSAKLMMGTALAGVVAFAPEAVAQNANPPPANSAETVVVTGTSIRGAAPTGSNLITVDRSTIEATGAQTTQELLTFVPQVNINFGSSGQAIEGGGGNESGPTLHSLGNQSANATLILIDGHRIPASGQTTAVVDPSIVPAAALERVEVLPDGASSIYGADAVAGVINFITRKDFTGWETSAQYGYAPSYNAFNFSQLWGANWTGGNILIAYDYSSKSNLMNSARSFITARQDIRRGADVTTAQFPALQALPANSMLTTPAAGQGTTGPFGVAIPYASDGSNFQNFSCPIATIAASSNAGAFLYPYNGSIISTSQTTPNQGVCDTTALTTSLPSQTRNSIIINVRQAITPSITATLDVIMGSIVGTTIQTRGAITATVFGPTGNNPSFAAPNQAAGRNPFYTSNATVGTASETIRYDFDALLGPGAYDHNTGTNMVGVLGFTWDIGGDWAADLDVDVGQSQTPERTVGGVCGPCALEALNGTTSAAGTANTSAATSATPDSNGLGTIISVTRPLTTLNALDVWNPPGSTNRTSAATLASLVDANTYANGVITLMDLSTKVDGPIVDLWAGSLKGAFGAEYSKQALDRETTGGSTIGGAAGLSTFNLRSVNKTNTSAFAELLLPLVSEMENVPLIRKLDLDVSGRYDHFSGFGVTYNPKVGVNWTVIDGFTTHASYGTSFMAPEIISLGGGLGSIQSGGVTNGLIVPFNTTLNYSADPRTFAGEGIANTFVNNAANCFAAGSNPVDNNGNTVTVASGLATGCKVSSSGSPGLQIRGTVPNLGPQTGLSYSAGFAIEAGKILEILDGLHFEATYYNTKFQGYITNQQVNATVPSTNAFAPPGGWTPTSAAIQGIVAGRSLTLALPPLIWTVVQNQVRNAFSLWQEGVDFSIHYRFDTDDLGRFTFGIDGNQIIRFAQGQNESNAQSIVDGRNGGRQTGIELTEVTSIGWQMNPFQVQIQMQFAHPYSIVNNSFPFNLSGTLNASTPGTQHIGPLYNFNAHMAYNLPDGQWTSGMQVYVNVDNILNTAPPYADTTSGAGGGNQIGREFVVGFRKQF